MVLEAAAAKDHAARRAYRLATAVTFDFDTGDGARGVGEQTRDRRLQPDWHGLVEQRTAQPADQRIAHRQPSRAFRHQPPRQVAEITESEIGRATCRERVGQYE